jgi:predicted transcriptional regulator
MFTRHPCSLPELAFALDVPENTVKPLIKDLLHQHKIEAFEIRGRELFRYTPINE